jgi:hypothetical protein
MRIPILNTEYWLLNTARAEPTKEVLHAPRLCAATAWVLAALTMLPPLTAQAQTISWNFGTNAAPLASPSSNSAAHVTAGCLTNGNNHGTTVLLTEISRSDTYAGASGSYNACATAKTGALAVASSTYFTFTLTPDATNTLRVTGLSFGSRSTSTGPLAFCVRSSLDDYAADLATGTLAANGNWALKSVAFAAFSQTPATAMTLRIYGYNGAGNAGNGNWRIDDLAVAVSAAGTNTPPVVLPIGSQTGRVASVLSFSLIIGATDGDPVTATNVTASTGVVGAFGLTNGVFTYTPVEADLGEQVFTFTAQDKDGTSESMVVHVFVQPTQTLVVEMTGVTGSYTQNFNTLASSSTLGWTNAVAPLPSWYAYAGITAITNYRTVASATGSLYSYGTNAEDRSLGSLASDDKTYRFGIAFTNTTGQTVTHLTINFTAEQWWVGKSAATNTLSFHYCITNGVLPLSDTAEWRPVAALDYDSPLTTNTQDDGACYVSAARSAAITRYPILPGEVLLLRWSDPNDAGGDHGLGIDDLTVGWAAGDLQDSVAVGRTGASEDFNEMGRAAPATLVWAWRTETNGPYASAGTRALRANTTTNVMQAGTYVFTGQGLDDQAIGGLPCSNAAATVTVYGKFRNTTGEPIRRWRVRYAVEKYRNGTASTAVQLRVSTNGATWIAAGGPAGFAADGDTTGAAAGAGPLATERVEREATLDAAIPECGLFYLAWQIAVTEGQSVIGAQALGIDEVRIEPMYSTGTVLMVR